MATSAGARSEDGSEPRLVPPGRPSAGSRLGRIRRPGVLVSISLAYVLLISGIMIVSGISVSPDYLVVIFIPVAALAGRFVRFLKDWVPFAVIFLGWEAMRGIVAKDGIAPHVADIANVETTLFGGHLPTAILQSWLSGPFLHGFAVAGTVVYFLHFVVPLLVGLVLWLKDRTQFLRFTSALMGMALVAFLFYLFLPTAPPWYAMNQKLIGGFSKLIDGSLPSAVSPYYHSLNPNQTAAFPSLHAAFPFLGFLALRRVYRRASWLALGWSVVVWFSVVFLGEHYVVDVIGGVALAAGSWVVMMRLVVPRVSLLRVAAPTLPARPAPEAAVA
jgi:membrane-associated phospholipid phosphatase